MSSDTNRLVKVEIDCIDLPSADWGGHGQIWLGIQEGKSVVQAVRLPSDDIRFLAELRVEVSAATGKPNFLGPFAHGTPQERFLYLCWGQPFGGGWAGFRRAKLPLGSLSWEDLSTGTVKLTVRCTDAKGGPACATLKGDALSWFRK